jgi:hypothetical protein
MPPYPSEHRLTGHLTTPTGEDSRGFERGDACTTNPPTLHGRKLPEVTLTCGWAERPGYVSFTKTRGIMVLGDLVPSFLTKEKHPRPLSDRPSPK